MNEDYLIPKITSKRGKLEKESELFNLKNIFNDVLRNFKVDFNHVANPLHIYCRTRNCLSFLGKYEKFFQDENRNKKMALKLSRSYEKYFYNRFDVKI